MYRRRRRSRGGFRSFKKRLRRGVKSARRRYRSYRLSRGGVRL